MPDLSHFDESGASRMVDVGQKPVTSRLARAVGYVTMQPATLRLILNRELAKGDVIEVARLAGIMGSKQTASLIPLCHPLPIDSVKVAIEPSGENRLRIEAEVTVQGRTGVEMEALTAVTTAALTVYDMCKAVDRSMQLGPIGLLEKSGGKSGHFEQRIEPDE